MRPTILILLFTTTGCSSYTAAQLRLTEQARKGVAIWSARESARDQEVRQTHAARRKALDDAFDADVRTRGPALDPAWVIESRRAYAAGLTVLAQSESAALAGNDAARCDAAAADDALAKLAWLLSIQADARALFTDLFTGKGGTK
jgi:hypothetical protein